MAIEPLGSVMSLQAQNVMKTKPAEQTMELPDVALQSPQAVDKTTVVVEPSQGRNKENAAEQNKEQNREQAGTEQIRKAVEQLNKKMSVNSEAVFGIHEGTNRVTIKIVDKNTKETIKELPPEKTLDMIAKVWEIAGILVDEKR